MVLPKTKRITKSANTTDAGGKFVGLGSLDPIVSFTTFLTNEAAHPEASKRAAVGVLFQSNDDLLPRCEDLLPRCYEKVKRFPLGRLHRSSRDSGTVREPFVGPFLSGHGTVKRMFGYSRSSENKVGPSESQTASSI